jgi:hypothetical protein
MSKREVRRVSVIPIEDGLNLPPSVRSVSKSVDGLDADIRCGTETFNRNTY